MKPFIEAFVPYDLRDIYIVGVDEAIKHGYSHVAILTHSMSRSNIKVAHGVLRSTKDIKYSGKSLQYRLENSRDFIYSGPTNCDIILVDDIITSGLTLQQAYDAVSQKGNRVLFALTLADAQK